MKAVILAGGGGTRLWPLSTLERPKQFQKLVSEKTMLEETIERLDFLDASDIYIAINEKHIGLTRDLCPNIPEENIIIEPALRDTSSCIGFAAAIIEKRHPGEVMAVIYADHLIKNKEDFQEKLKLAEEIALKENTLNIVEVTAHEPNPNYGYVKLGECLDPDQEIYMIDCFKEKPDVETAKKFLESGDYLWNTGIYVWKASTLLEKYKELQPETHQKFATMAEAYDTDEQKTVVATHYPTLEKISIDFAIMEKVDTSEIRILKADLGWSDVGTWEAIWEELTSSQEANIERGEVKLIDCKGSTVYSDSDKKVAVIGLEDIVVIDTPEGLLVCKKEDSKRVKEI
jgi:mannose-1-phosphate guanylyltransferase